MNQKVKALSAGFPPEMRDLLIGLSDDCRLAILMALARDGELTLEGLEERTGLGRDELLRHLDVLQNGLLVQNFWVKKGKDVSFPYAVTDISNAVLDAVYDTLYRLSPEESAAAHEAAKRRAAEAAGAARAASMSKNPPAPAAAADPPGTGA